MTPTFPENELALYKQNTIEDLKFQRSQPDFLADEQISRILYGTHPYAIVSPTPKRISKKSRAKNWSIITGERFIPNNATLIVVGDVDKDELLKRNRRRFSAGGKRETSKRSEFRRAARTNAKRL